jgi:ribosomal protein S1
MAHAVYHVVHAASQNIRLIAMSNHQVLKERRTMMRTCVLKSAQIIIGDHAAILECVVRNLTTRGACLEIGNAAALPDTFDLTFNRSRNWRPCRAIWRAADKVGVAFVGLQ